MKLKTGRDIAEDDDDHDIWPELNLCPVIVLRVYFPLATTRNFA